MVSERRVGSAIEVSSHPEMSSSAWFEYVPVEGDWQAYILAVPEFPIPAAERPSLCRVTQALLSLAAIKLGYDPLVFLQCNHFHVAESNLLLQQHAADWNPELGLAVWPDRGQVRPWTREQFESFEPGERVEPMLNPVFQITAPRKAIQEAVELLLGGGTLLMMFSAGSGNELLERANRVLGPLAKHPSFPPFEFTVPLFGLANLKEADARSLEDWTCGADLYFRESVEDSGLLLLARKSVSQELRNLQVAGPDGDLLVIANR